MDDVNEWVAIAVQVRACGAAEWRATMKWLRAIARRRARSAPSVRRKARA
jgi:hypothetical protein